MAKLFLCHWLHVARTVHDYMRVDLPGLCCYKGWLHAAKTNCGCIQSEICAVLPALKDWRYWCIFFFPIRSAMHIRISYYQLIGEGGLNWETEKIWKVKDSKINRAWSEQDGSVVVPKRQFLVINWWHEFSNPPWELPLFF